MAILCPLGKDPQIVHPTDQRQRGSRPDHSKGRVAIGPLRWTTYLYVSSQVGRFRIQLYADQSQYDAAGYLGSSQRHLTGSITVEVDPKR